ncbi:PEGA domain protein [Calidithermus terrae]|uniref:PEGA domain protein n=1 Tax=Calidithermus terrae TaxID=1408545 RepID=A0A399F168_9DEIN|nr:PEGA domain-containing protein [Calidithermus terrae]RIH90527.1 PEGA domain protein [Calidithermus terrae]
MIRSIHWLHCLLLIALGSLALGQRIDPQRIIVNPVPTDLQVRVWVDKDPSKSGAPVYQVGENIRVSVQTNQDAYVYLFGVLPSGDIDLILPNPYDQDNFIRANEVATFPPVGARYTFDVTPPFGESVVLAVASRTPLDLSRVYDIANNRALVNGRQELGQAMAIVVEPLPDQDWVSDVAFYYVGQYTPPPPPTGTLVIDSNPAGATVYINGQRAGTTPATLTLDSGQYSVQLTYPGYEPYRTTLSVEGGTSTRISANLRRINLSGTLAVTSNPPGAQVFVNGQLVGNTPVNLSLNPGSYTLELRRQGYQTYRTTVAIAPGANSRVNVNLSPAVSQGVLTVTSNPSNADVYVNGRLVGRTPYSARLNSGTYTVEVRRAGYQDYRTTVTVQAGRTTTVNATLALPAPPTGSTGVLSVVTDVPGADVYIDGRLAGRTPINLQLRPGRYTLEVRSGGRVVYRQAVQVRPNRTTTVRIETR